MFEASILRGVILFTLLSFSSLLLATPNQMMMDTTILMAEGEQACSGDTVTVAITTSNFDSITAFQFSLTWDPNLVTLIDSCNAFVPNINFNPVGNNNVVVTWLESSGEAVSLPPGDTIIVFKMNVMNISPGGIPINFGILSPSEVIASTASGTNIFTPITVNGLISFNDINSQATATPITCADTLSSLSATAIGESPSFEWYYDNNLYAQMADTVARDSGVYTLIATSGNCMDTSFVQIVFDTMPPAFQPIMPDTLDCNNTSVMLSANTMPGQDFFWLFPGIDTLQANSITTDTVGTFYLQIVDDQNGCFSIDTIEVTDIVVFPDIGIAGDTLLNCLNDSIALSAQLNGNTTNLSIAWQNAMGNTIATTDTLVVNQPQEYILSVMDTSNFCVSNDTILINIDTIPPSVVIMGDSILNCLQDTLTLSANSPSNDVLFEWYDEIGSLISDSSSVLVFTPGNYQLVGLDTINGCSSSVFQQISIDTIIPNASIVNGVTDTLTCINDELTLEGNSTTTNTIGIWEDATGTILSNTNNLQVDTAGIYFFVLTNQTNGCDTTVQIEIFTDTISPLFTLQPVDAIDCMNDSVSLSIQTDPGNLCEWQNIDNTCEVTVTLPGSYISIVTNPENGCTRIDSVMVLDNTTFPQFQLTSTGPLNCVDLSVDLSPDTINASFDYFWLNENSDTIATQANTNVATPGSYTLIVSDPFTACTTIDSILVAQDTIAPSGLIPALPPISCGVDTVNLEIQNLSSNTTVDWVNEIGDTLILPVATTPGVYQVILLDTLNGCIFIDSVAITSDQLLPAVDIITQIDSILNCITPAVSLFAQSSATNFSIAWQDSLGNELSTDTMLSVNQAGAYFLAITDNNNNCTALDSITISGNFIAPQITISDTIAILNCNQDSTIFTASSDASTAGYSWQDNMGIVLSNTDSFTINMSGQYQLIVTDSLNGCTNSLMVMVLENTEAPPLEIIGDTVLTCSDTILLLSVNNPIDSISYEWLDEQGMLLSDSAILEVNTVGTYQLIAIDSINGCQSSLTQEIITSTPAPLISITNGVLDTINCIIGSVLLEGVSGNNVEVQWQNSMGDSIANINTLVVDSAGIFTFYAIDNISGCDTALQVTVVEDTIAPPLNVEMPGMLNCETDSIIIVANSPSSTSCMWEGNNDNSCSIIVTAPGTYAITVTDLSNGCTSIDSVEVLADVQTPDIMVSTTNGILGCNDDDFLFTGSSMSDSVQIEWQNSNGELISLSNDLLANTIGTYVFIVLDTLNGCSDSIEVQLIENLDAPNIDVIGDTVLTCSDTILLLSVNNPIDSISYEWFDEQGMPLSDSAVLEVNTVGTYQLIAIDSINGCQSSLTQEIITSTPAPLISITNGVLDTINCITGSVLLEGVSGNNVEVQWQNSMGDSIANTNTLVVDSAGIFTFYAIDNISGCDTALQVTVVEDTIAPPLNVEMPGMLNCETDSITLVANSPLSTSCMWEGNNDNSCSIIVTAPGTYAITVTDLSNGCTSIDSVEVLADVQTPDIMVSTTNGILGCNDDDFLFTGSSMSDSVQIEWQNSNGELISLSNDLLANTIGTYVFIVLDTLNGCSDSIEVQLTENLDAPPVGIIGNTTLTCLDTILLLSVSNPVDSISYEWLDEQDMLLSDSTGLEVNTAGTYQLIATYTFNDCPSSDTIEISQSIEIPEVVLTYTTPEVITCENEVVSLEVTSNDNTLSYIWQNINGDTITQLENATITEGGNYELIATNLFNGCSFDTTFNIAENLDPPLLDIFLEQVFDCVAEQAIVSTIENPNYLYTWTSDTGTITSPSEASTEVTALGQYTVEVENTENGCTNSGSIEVNSIASQISSIDLEAVPIPCNGLEGGTLIINDVNGIEATVQYAVDVPSSFANNPIFTGLTAGPHQLFVIDPNGCVYDTTFNIPDALGHDVFINALQNPISIGDTVLLNAQVNIPQEDIVNIQWFDTSPICDSCTLSIAVNPASSTTYLVQTTDIEGCISEAFITLVVESRIGVYAPNAFSPNEDGRNDIFYIHTDDNITNIKELSIFSRWGTMVYNRKNIAPNDPTNGWDGNFMGEELDPAVFVYYVELELANGEIIIRSGDITLLR